jgi:hypothetical protein
MSDITTTPPRNGADIMERVITTGDLSKLTPAESVQYYKAVCDSVGLNPLTRPFEYLTLQGKRILYARRDAADQLRRIHHISVEVVERKIVGDLLIVHVRAREPSGRSDEDLGVVSVANIKGEAMAVAMLKAITKAKRRVTLSICGLGVLDESEIDDAQATAPPLSARAQLDAFADDGASPDHLMPTASPEPTGPRDVFAERDYEAKAATVRGAKEFRAWFKALPQDDKDILMPFLPDYEALAAEVDRNARLSV